MGQFEVEYLNMVSNATRIIVIEVDVALCETVADEWKQAVIFAFEKLESAEIVSRIEIIQD